MTTSVLIASHNKHRFLAATLACLTGQSTPPDEVILVDDASAPPLGGLPGVTHSIRREGPRHVQAARNLGLARATGEIVLLMDDDCLVREDYVARHLWRHARDPGHLVAGSVRRIDYHGQRAFWELPAVEGAVEYRTLERRAGLLLSGVAPWTLAPCSNNVSVARAALLGTGGYDEEYRGWGVDDVDLTYRLMAGGTPLLIDAGPEVFHQEHPWSPDERHGEEARNLACFARRHRFWAYGKPPPAWGGSWRYPAHGLWFHAQALSRAGEPAAIRVTPTDAPNAATPRIAHPLDCVLGTELDAVVTVAGGRN